MNEIKMNEIKMNEKEMTELEKAIQENAKLTPRSIGIATNNVIVQAVVPGDSNSDVFGKELPLPVTWVAGEAFRASGCDPFIGVEIVIYVDGFWIRADSRLFELHPQSPPAGWKVDQLAIDNSNG